MNRIDPAHLLWSPRTWPTARREPRGCRRLKRDARLALDACCAARRVDDRQPARDREGLDERSRGKSRPPRPREHRRALEATGDRRLRRAAPCRPRACPARARTKGCASGRGSIAGRAGGVPAAAAVAQKISCPERGIRRDQGPCCARTNGDRVRAGPLPEPRHCWARGTATIMILASLHAPLRFLRRRPGRGRTATYWTTARRRRTVAAMNCATPESRRWRATISRMGGSTVFAQVIARSASARARCRSLDSRLPREHGNLQRVIDARPEVINHNIENRGAPASRRAASAR